MKTRVLYCLTPSMLAAMFLLAACSSTVSPPAVGSAKMTYAEGVTGGVQLQTVRITATVTAIDLAERQATLQAADGMKFTVKMGPGATKFDQLRVGDPIAATVTQKVVISPNDEATPSSVDPTAESIQKTGKVIAIDARKRMVTLRFDDGVTETLPVRSDVDLSQHKLGEAFDFHVTEMTASWIEKTQ